MAQDQTQQQDQAQSNPQADGQTADPTQQTAEDNQLQALLDEANDLRTKLMRWQADFSNLQRRSAQEVLSAKQNADADFAKALLTVLDHFDMALSVDPSKVDAATVLNGIKITYDELKKTLANRGIQSFDPTGKPFDPHQHEAIMQEPSDKFPPMTVTQTFQAGYRIGDRILRPAKVKVSK